MTHFALTHPLSTPTPFRPAAPVSAEAQLVRDVLCRVLNVTVAVIGLLITAPLMLFVAIATKLTSPGPVIYTQIRIGCDRRSVRRAPVSDNEPCGRPFRIYKFRTMHVAAPDAPQVLAKKGDPRITPIGRFLRKFRLDELPQLYNVVIGDMNVVGPRPEQPDIVRRLRASVRNYAKRQRVLPGITGLAQVTMSYEECANDIRRKVALDLEYVSRRSPLEDLRIMLRTTRVMLGATGI